MVKSLIILVGLIQALWAGAQALHLAAEWRFNQKVDACVPALYPWDYKYDLVLGFGHLQGGNTRVAIRYFEAVLARAPRHVNALINLGIAHAMRGDKQRAERIFVRALEIAPGDFLARRNLAVVRGQRPGKYDMGLAGS